MIAVQAGSFAQWAGTLANVAPFGHAVPVTVAGGANRILICVLSSGLQNTSDYTVTFGGTPMTALVGQSGGSVVRHMIFYMLNPPAGTNDLFVGVSGWWGQSCNVQAFALDGVDQATPFGAAVSNSLAFGTSPYSTSINVAASDLLISAFGTAGAASTLSVAGGETAFGGQVSDGNNISARLAYKSGGAIATAWTFTGSPQPSTLAVAVKAAGGGGGGATVTSVTVYPSAPSVAGGATQQFSATVEGTNSPAQTVTWTVSGAGASINIAGLFTAPAATGVAQTFTVTATSTVDGTHSGVAIVTVPAAAYSPYPLPADVRAGVQYGASGELVGALIAAGGGGAGILIGGRLGLSLDGKLIVGVT